MLGGCSETHIGPGGKVRTADLRAGKLPVAVEVCVTVVATYYDSFAGTLVVQDEAGAIKFDGMKVESPRYGQRLEVCGETRRIESGMTLAKPGVKLMGKASLPVAKRTSPEEWSRNRVDWQWIEVEGMAYAVTLDRTGHLVLHMAVDGRRVRVKILGTEAHPELRDLMGARVRVAGVASQTSGSSGNEDLRLLSPDLKFVVEAAPQAPVASMPVTTVTDAVRMAGAVPERRVRLRGSIFDNGAGHEQWFRDATGELRLTLQRGLPGAGTMTETDDAEIAGFPVRAGSGAAALEGPVSTQSETPSGHGKVSTIRQVHALSASEAARALPVKLLAVVTYHNGNTGETYIQDTTDGIFTWRPDAVNGGFSAGDMVEVTATTHPGDFAPVLWGTRLRRIGPGVMPKPAPADLDTLFTGREDGNWVQAEGSVSAVGGESNGAVALTVVKGLRTFVVYLADPGPLAGHLLDARVRVEGACGTRFNERRQLIGIKLSTPSWKYVTILTPGVVNTADIPETPISRLLQYSFQERRRVRVRGTLTLVDPSGLAFVEDSTAGIQVQSAQQRASTLATRSKRSGSRCPARFP